MPVSYHIDPARRWVDIKLSGQVSIAEARAGAQRLFADPAYNDDLSGVIDCREMENVMLVTELRALADLQLTRPGPAGRSRRAVLVASPQHYATARMFTVFAEAGPVEYGVFYKLESALEWIRG